MSDILILSPRLDVPFKNLGDVPDKRGPIPPIREYWADFVESLAYRCRLAGDDVTICEKPLWQFKPSDVVGYDEAYIPHKDRFNFYAPNDEIHILYYAQAVIPFLFSVDEGGWGGNILNKPIATLPPGSGYAKLKEWVDSGQSKFGQDTQPKLGLEPNSYIVMPLQLPHDENVVHQSDVSMIDAMVMTIRWAKKHNKKLVLKAHPINLASMGPLQAAWIAEGMYGSWVEDCSIHDLLKNAEAVFVVNSGTGLEALIHSRPVFCFGRRDYEAASYTIENGDIDAAWALPRYSDYTIKSFLETWYCFHYDTTREPTGKLDNFSRNVMLS